MRNQVSHIIAVDGGGSTCRVAIGTADGRIIGQATGPSANPTTSFPEAVDSLRTTLGKAQKAAGLTDEQIRTSFAYLGLAGVISADIANAIAKAFPTEKVSVTDDRPTTMAGALQGRDGFVAAIGTGSFLGSQSAQDRRFVGGWGLLLGDQASGAWLGRLTLARVLEWQDGLHRGSDLLTSIFREFGDQPSAIVLFAATARPQDFATFAPRVLDAADAGDAAALAMIQDGARYLQQGLDALGFRKGDRLCLMGGVGQRYAIALGERYTDNLVDPLGSSLDGAIWLAMDVARAENTG